MPLVAQRTNHVRALSSYSLILLPISYSRPLPESTTVGPELLARAGAIEITIRQCRLRQLRLSPYNTRPVRWTCLFRNSQASRYPIWAAMNPVLYPHTLVRWGMITCFPMPCHFGFRACTLRPR